MAKGGSELKLFISGVTAIVSLISLSIKLITLTLKGLFWLVKVLTTPKKLRFTINKDKEIIEYKKIQQQLQPEKIKPIRTKSQFKEAVSNAKKEFDTRCEKRMRLREQYIKEVLK